MKERIVEWASIQRSTDIKAMLDADFSNSVGVPEDARPNETADAVAADADVPITTKMRVLVDGTYRDIRKLAGLPENKLKVILILGGGQAAAGIVPQNVQQRVVDELFIPFSSAEFPLLLHPQRLTQMLKTPPACLVPAGPEHQAELAQRWPVAPHLAAMPPLFTSSVGEVGGEVEEYLRLALTQRLPTYARTEMEFVGFWNNCGYSLPWSLSTWHGYPITMGRNRMDESITVGEKRRDLLIFCSNVLVVGGEDKPAAQDLQDAIQVCKEKHKAVNSISHGRLSYILLVATAGYKMQILAIPMDNPNGMQKISGVIELNTNRGRCECLLAWINISRWIVTVLQMHLLPLSPLAELNTPIPRRCPYAGGASGTIEFRMRKVVKVLYVPASHLQVLIDVHQALRSAQAQGTVKCTRMKMDGTEVPFVSTPQQAMRTRKWQSLRLDSTLDIWHKIELELSPLGARWQTPDVPSLHGFTSEVLQALHMFHEASFVHRDLREENIVQADFWIIIDFELAAPVGTPVFWRGPNQPASARLGAGWTPAMDLHQLGCMLGRLLGNRCLESSPVLHYARQLSEMKFSSAAEALAAIPALSVWLGVQ